MDTPASWWRGTSAISRVRKSARVRLNNQSRDQVLMSSTSVLNFKPFPPLIISFPSSPEARAVIDKQQNFFILKMLGRIPAPKRDSWLFGHLNYLNKLEHHQIMTDWANQLGGIYRMRLAWIHVSRYWHFQHHWATHYPHSSEYLLLCHK